MQIKGRYIGGAFAILVLGLLAGYSKSIWLWALLSTKEWQRTFHEQISTYLHMIQETHSISATCALALVGFTYGVIHAVGPGHGKVVISSYLLANKRTLRHGLLTTFLTAFMQAGVAIALMAGALSLLNLSQGKTTYYLEQGSIGLIGLVGLFLLFRGIKGYWKAYQGQEDGEHCDDCPVPEKGKKLSLLAIVFSVGLRPCSGALLLLLFASVLDVFYAGVLATLAMALGTAITTSTLACLAVYSRNLAVRLSGSKTSYLLWINATLSIMGGGIIILFTMALLSFGPMTQSPLSTPASGKAHPLLRNIEAK